jgi:hypothetical protein
MNPVQVWRGLLFLLKLKQFVMGEIQIAADRNISIITSSWVTEILRNLAKALFLIAHYPLAEAQRQ